MTSPLEAELARAVRPVPVRQPHTTDWEDVLARAARMRRRDRSLQRIAVLGFITLIGFGLLRSHLGDLVTTPAAGGSGEVPAAGPARVRWEFLAPSLVALAGLGAAFLVHAGGRVKPQAVGWRRRYVLMATAPILYGPVMATAEELGGTTGSPVVIGGAVALKLLSVLTIPLLLWFLADRAAEVPSRWRTLTVVWLVLGVAVVLAARGLIDDIVRVVTGHLWPETFSHNAGWEETVQHLESPPGPDWTPGTILQFELAAVVLLALVSGTLIRAFQGRPALAAAATSIGVFFGLGLYAVVAPLTFVNDFDPFVGDLVLGGVFAELLFFMFPFDVVGALALSAASLSITTLLWLWGGPVDRPI